MVWLLHHWLCRDARARAPVDQRTRTLEAIRGDSNAEADHLTKAARQTSPPLLAGPLLRFSGMERSQTHREAALHPSQSGEAGLGGEAGGLEMEQLPSPRNWDGRGRRDRIAMDRAEARTSRSRARGKSPPSRKQRGKGGATSEEFWFR